MSSCNCDLIEAFAWILHVNVLFIFGQCPLYGKAKEPKKSESKEEGPPAEDEPKPDQQNDLMQDGLVFKQCVKDKIVDRRAHNQVQLANLYTIHNHHNIVIIVNDWFKFYIHKQNCC